jgi:hypothetical protein
MLLLLTTVVLLCVAGCSSGGGGSSSTTTTPTTQAPAIITQPTAQTINDGSTATFSVTASGSSPLSYQWNLGGAAISGATSTTYTTGTLAIADTGKSYTVTVTNSVGSVTSSAATVTVHAAPPTVTVVPGSQAVASNVSVNFVATAKGTAPFTYQWFVNGTAVTGATSAAYSTPFLTVADSGKSYTVTVTNAGGSVTSAPVVITVNPLPPTITVEPGGAVFFIGETATLKVVAAGTTPSYQWALNGSAIPGATAATFTTPVLSSANNNDSYTVTVSNSAGTVTSAAAVLKSAPAAVTYTSETGAKMSLYAWPGQKTIILTASNTLDTTVMRKFLAASDGTYSYYATALGKEPPLYIQYDGKPSIAEMPAPTVPSCGGAACTEVGATGMEIADPYFQWMLYAIPNNAYDQVMFYEWGRAFWLFPQLNFTAPDSNSCIVTGFAILMRFRSVSALGYQGSFNSFAGSAADTSAAKAGITNYNNLATTNAALIDAYTANTSLNWSNTFLANSFTNPNGGCSDLFASLVQRLAQNYGGETFIQALWKQVLLRPAPTTTQTAIDNFILASSAAAGKNLSKTFMTTWRWPESDAAQAEAQTKWGAPQ